MKIFHQNLLWGAAATVLLTGCIDNNYDLSDIDTTSEFKINDLVIPINLETVVLDDIIKVEEGDRLEKVTINGKTFYAVQQSGEFSSDGVDVSSFRANPGNLEDKTAVFVLSDYAGLTKRRADWNGKVTLALQEPVNEDLSYEASDVDGSIRALTYVNFSPITFSVTISTKGLPSGASAQLNGVRMVIPKGLNITEVMAGGERFLPNIYNSNSGALNFTDRPIGLTTDPSTGENHTTIELTIVGVDLTENGETFVYDPETNSGSFNLQSVFNLNYADLNIENLSEPITTLSYNIHYGMDAIEATSILGSIAYDLSGTGLDIKPIDLTDIPDFLDSPQTNLILSNPQIYLHLMNPIGKYGLPYQSGLEIIALRPGEDNKSFVSPIVKVPGKVGDFNFLLSPVKTSDIPEDYSPLTEDGWLEYNGLGQILSGTGLPKTLDIQLVDPMIPQTAVTSFFELNQQIEGMEGTYLFLAPLSLKGRKVENGVIVEEGSEIVKTVDGWWSEDLSDLNIEDLTISADITNGLPTGVLLNVYAIDRDGKQISTEGTLDLPYKAVATPASISLKGIDGKPINNLDGIRLYVIAEANDGEPLAPSQTITLDNIKAKVTGNYTRKL